MADDKDNSIENPENRELTDVGLRQRDDRVRRSEEGIAAPQGEFGADLAVKYEATDIPLRPIFVTSAIVIGMTLASYIVLYGMYWFWGAREDAEKVPSMPIMAERQPLPPEPRLQPMIDPANPQPLGSEVLRSTEIGDYVIYEAEEKKRLAALNINQAMDQIAANGLPKGPEWQMAPGTVMVQGVVMTAAEAAAQQEALRSFAQRQGMDVGAAAAQQTTLPSAGAGTAAPQAGPQAQPAQSGAPSRPTAGRPAGNQ